MNQILLQHGCLFCHWSNTSKHYYISYYIRRFYFLFSVAIIIQFSEQLNTSNDNCNLVNLCSIKFWHHDAASTTPHWSHKTIDIAVDMMQWQHMQQYVTACPCPAIFHADNLCLQTAICVDNTLQPSHTHTPLSVQHKLYINTYTYIIYMTTATWTLSKLYQ